MRTNKKKRGPMSTLEYWNLLVSNGLRAAGMFAFAEMYANYRLSYYKRQRKAARAKRAKR